ncbi:Uncharacterized protein PCOAH_00004460 [Plasmodium coatneyi]|uniref:Uncharacterized protein n=1 Tax=Plasmodium coatneyi TaxID=208452 RepID=A0A1B1DU36_9APIC|nr:Uncharacterized protein PCOAH_00004460 [Plasmodium coatneyi]ANQ06095.1 Uncharacterized protein PCOAH_00004460 [Plasmodium coatneyi]
MGTRRNVREVAKKITQRYLSSVNVAHFICSTILLNYLVAHFAVTGLGFSPRGGKHPLLGGAKWMSPSLEEEPYTHTVCLTYVLLSVLYYVTKLVAICAETTRKKGPQVEGRTNGSTKRENVPLATRWRRQLWVTSIHLISYVLLTVLGMHRGRRGKPSLFPFILAVCEMGTPLISLINILGAVKRVDLLLFLCYFAVERLWKKNLHRPGGGHALHTQTGEHKRRNAFRVSLKKEWFFPSCINLWVDWLERRLSPFRWCDVGKGEESTPGGVRPNRMNSPEGARQGGMSPPRNATSQVGTNCVKRHKGKAAGTNSDEEDNTSGGNNKGVRPHLETKSSNAQLGGKTRSEENGDSSNPGEKHHMKKGVHEHSGSHAHEESSGSQGELCERVRTNAHKYKHFYHQYCRGGGGDGDELEEESSSREGSFLKCPTLRERRKFNVIQGGEVASPERHNGSGKKGFNLGSPKIRNLNDKRSYTSLYFPSVIETDTEGGSISGDSISERSNNARIRNGEGDEHIGGPSLYKQKEKPHSQANTHNELHHHIGTYERDKLEGVEGVGTCLNEKGDDGFSVGHLLNDVNRREEGTNTSILFNGTYLQRGTEKKRKRKRKKRHCVYLPPDGMKCSQSNQGEDKAVSSNRVNSLEKHIRTSLSNFKRKKEILTFINDTYKTIFVTSILSMLLTKGILICTFLYFLQSVPVASGRPFPSGVFPMLQELEDSFAQLIISSARHSEMDLIFLKAAFLAPVQMSIYIHLDGVFSCHEDHFLKSLISAVVDSILCFRWWGILRYKQFFLMKSYV